MTNTTSFSVQSWPEKTCLEKAPAIRSGLSTENKKWRNLPPLFLLVYVVLMSETGVFSNLAAQT